MIPQREKNVVRKRVHQRIRQKMAGTAERPRLNVYRSLNHIYAQLIDDSKGVTIVSASTNEGAKDAKSKGAKTQSKDAPAKEAKAKEAPARDAKAKKRTGGNVASARIVGKALAERAKEKGVKAVVFDRGGYIYHGRVKALADAAREAGLQF